MTKYTSFNRTVLVTLVICLIPSLLNLLFVARVGEMMPIKEAAALQNKRGGLYGPAFYQNAYAYKLALHEIRKPDILVMGSSRTMQFRNFFFTRPMTNAGGAIHYIEEAEQFLEDALPLHTPKLVLLGLDFWWFHPERTPSNFVHHRLKGDEVTTKKLTLPTRLVLQGKISPAYYAEHLVSAPGPSPFINSRSIGLNAIMHANGFRQDGSYFYGATIFDAEYDFKDVRFKNTRKRIETGDGRFAHAADFDSSRLETLRSVARLCKEQGIRLVLFIPPMAPACLETMKETNGYGYVTKLISALKGEGFSAFDFHDPSALNSNPCEFIDGFHPGEVMVQRMLLTMALQSDAFDGFVSTKALEESIKSNAGRVLVRRPGDEYPAKELDFLDLGCTR